MNTKAGEILTAARKKLGLTQEEMASKLARALGQTYSQRQYQKLEDGSFPKYKKEIAITLDKMLGTKLYEVIYEHNIHEAAEDQAVYITKNPDPMSQDYREKFYQLLEKNSKLEEKIDANSKTMEGNVIRLTDLILQGQDSMVEKIGRELSQRLEALEKSIVSSLKVAPGKKPLQKGKH